MTEQELGDITDKLKNAGTKLCEIRLMEEQLEWAKSIDRDFGVNGWYPKDDLCRNALRQNFIDVVTIRLEALRSEFEKEQF